MALGLAACGRTGPAVEQTRVARTFTEWKQAMLDRQFDQAVARIAHPADAYLAGLDSAPAANRATSSTPGVDLLLHTALEQKIPADLRSHLTIGDLVRHVADHHLFNPRDVQQLSLGPVSVDGDNASAQIYYAGTLTALRLPFLKEGGAWKIDLLGLLPYVETLMRVDRAIKRETVTQQVDQLVSKLPPL